MLFYFKYWFYMVLALVNYIKPGDYITYCDSHAFGTVTALHVHVFSGKHSSVPHGSHRWRIWSSASASWVSSSGAWDAGRSSPAPSNTGQPCKTSGPRSHHPLLEEEEEQEGRLDLNLEEEEEEEELPFLAEEEEEEAHPCQVKVEVVEDLQKPFLEEEEEVEASLLLVKEEEEVEEEVQLLFWEALLRWEEKLCWEEEEVQSLWSCAEVPGFWLVCRNTPVYRLWSPSDWLDSFFWSRRPHKSLWMIPYRRRDAAGSSHTSPSQLNPQRERKITWWNHHISSVPYRLN